MDSNELDFVAIKRERETRTWNEIDHDNWDREDDHATIHQRKSNPLSRILFSKQNIQKIQYAVRKAVIKITQKNKGGSIDIGVQPASSITNELVNWYGNTKLMNVDIPKDQLSAKVREVNHKFVINRLLPNVLGCIEDKQLYDGWAMKVPEPWLHPIADNDYDRTVNMEQYYDDSWGGHYKGKEWDWSQSALYDEPPSLYKRYPTNESKNKDSRNRASRNRASRNR